MLADQTRSIQSAGLLARQVASLTGETLTDAIRTVLRERLHNEQLKREAGPGLANVLAEITARCAALPMLDHRGDDEILGYDETSVPN